MKETIPTSPTDPETSLQKTSKNPRKNNGLRVWAISRRKEPIDKQTWKTHLLIKSLTSKKNVKWILPKIKLK